MVYDLGAAQWFELPQFPDGFGHFGQFTVPSDKLDRVQFVTVENQLVAWDGETILLLVDGAWNAGSEPPFESRAGAAIVATGGSILVWGGRVPLEAMEQTPVRDGAVWDPRKDKWTPMTEAPLPAGLGALGEPLLRGGVVLHPTRTSGGPTEWALFLEG